MNKWKVIPTIERCTYESSFKFIITQHKIVAPSCVEIVSLRQDGAPQKYWAVAHIKDNIIETREQIPKGTKIEIKYFTVVKLN